MTATDEKRRTNGLELDDLLKAALASQASDVHFVAGRRPMFRVHGAIIPLKEKPPLSANDTLSLAQQAAANGQWEKFLQNRELDFSMSRSGIGRFRANLYLQRGSVAIAIRVIPHEIPTLAELGLPPVLGTFALSERGLFLAAGPAGSGKSATLAAMLDHINANRSCHIVTIEDPIEYLHADKKALVNQREMHQDTLSFKCALHHLLRQDPDVVFIGELRDAETMETALRLAETGRLVLGTMHTADTTQALTRIIDAYPARQQLHVRTRLSLALVGIVAQQLIPRRDRPGRALAYEILANTPPVGHLIRSGEIQQVYSVVQAGSSDGMLSLNSSLLRLCLDGVISREDAIRKSARVKELLEQLQDTRLQV